MNHHPIKFRFARQTAFWALILCTLCQNVNAQTTSPEGTRSPLNSPAAKSSFNPIPFKITGTPKSPSTRQAKSSTKVPATQTTFRSPTKNSVQVPGQKPTHSNSFSAARGNLQPQTGFESNSAPNSSFSPTKLPAKQIASRQSLDSPQLPDTVECDVSSVHFIDDIKLPAKEAGEIKKLNYKEGDFIPAGQTIGVINDEVFQMMLEQAEMRYQIALDTADDETASLAARKKYQVASIEAQKTAKLAASGSKSPSDKLMADYTKEIALLEMRKADRERRKALAQAKLADAEKRQVQSKIARHTLKSDFDAYVVQIFKKEQEYVQTGEEVMRLARMDRLWVQSVVSYQDLNAYELKNRKVTITVPLARGESTTFEGVIKFVGLERQGPELMMVKAEVINRPINGHWVLHPEAEVQMTIHLNEPPSPIGSESKGNVNR
ncbi:MAG: HlyD family efflux transporter periplasmic adaptor subunit [Mariniblastus sp.]|nr:HlyD family efflux transporter periplasmic adaptor subunit [Mariniblastus sp.]